MQTSSSLFSSHTQPETDRGSVPSFAWRLMKILLLSTAILPANQAMASSEYFLATLEGAQEAPPSGSTAGGWARLEMNHASNTLSIRIKLTDLDLDGMQTGGMGDDVLGIHIHQAPAGVNGPVVFGLVSPVHDNDGDLSIDPVTGEIVSVWDTDEGNGGSLADFVAALQAGNLYINIHTTDHPGGAIRGQIVPAELLIARLSGSNEALPNDSTADGFAVLLLSSNGDALSTRLIVNGLDLDGTQTGETGDNVVGIHFHAAPEAVNGPVVFNWDTQDTDGDPLVMPSTGETISVWDGTEGSSTLAANLDTLLAGGLYINVHTTDFPGGEIRGQVRRSHCPDMPQPSCETHAGPASLQLKLDKKTGTSKGKIAFKKANIPDHLTTHPEENFLRACLFEDGMLIGQWLATLDDLGFEAKTGKGLKYKSRLNPTNLEQANAKASEDKGKLQVKFGGGPVLPLATGVDLVAQFASYDGCWGNTWTPELIRQNSDNKLKAVDKGAD